MTVADIRRLRKYLANTKTQRANFLGKINPE